MKTTTKAYLALIFICIVWGTTYLAIRVAVLVFPAFLLAAIRQFTAGIIILSLGKLFNKKVDITRANLQHQALVGLLLITVGNGLVSWGEKFIPSGVAALICSLMPICAVIINLILSKKETLNATIILGLLLGFCGVALIFRDDLTALSNRQYLFGIVTIFIATSSWALGSVLNKRKPNLVNPMFNAGLQVFFGGLFLFVLSPFIDNYSQINFHNTDFIYSILYLIIFGSILAYTAYMYALKELPVGIVTLYAYVNPLVAVVLGYLWLDEKLTIYTFLAFVTIVSGVYIVNYGYKKEHRKAIRISTE